MAPFSLPPGFGFHPTDEELVAYYLKRKVNGRGVDLDIIPEVDLYKCEPWDLPGKSKMQSKECLWHFFSPRDRKYPNGSRTNRATRAGYWKATGRDRKVTSQQRLIGTKKTLVFHQGRAPSGKRTDWVMHEYRIDESECQGSKDLKDSFVLCRIIKKNGFQGKGGGAITHPTENSGQCLVKDDVSDEVQLKESSTPDTEGYFETKEKLASEVNGNNIQEDLFSTEEWLRILDGDEGADCTLPPWDESSFDYKVGSLQEQCKPYETGHLSWDTANSSRDVNLELLKEAEILEELLWDIKPSEAGHLQNDNLEEDLSSAIDYSQGQNFNHLPESLDDYGFNQGDNGIVMRPRKELQGQSLSSETSSRGKLRLQIDSDKNYSTKQQGDELGHEHDTSNDDFICNLQEQEILFDSLAMQHEIGGGLHGRCPPPQTEANSRNEPDILQSYQNQSMDDVCSGSIHNHTISSLHTETCIMNGGSIEVVETNEVFPLVDRHERRTSEVMIQSPSESPKGDDSLRSFPAKSCTCIKGVTHRKKSKSNVFSTSGDDKLDSNLQARCESCTVSGNNTVEESGLSNFPPSRRTPSSPTSVIVFLFILGTFLLFLFFRGMLRIAKIISAIHF
eukprot:TRINITY_DN1382_c0_g2_i1.p1 TRINITY_DN1382_c0_g2~~TRINITY_DN1382_c0_g2_i1.p1  ORF type:complete len:619 (+),score=125.57 TRINITY_DN1382_c0_g2_i1:923-2779(+)